MHALVAAHKEERDGIRGCYAAEKERGKQIRLRCSLYLKTRERERERHSRARLCAVVSASESKGGGAAHGLDCHQEGCATL